MENIGKIHMVNTYGSKYMVNVGNIPYMEHLEHGTNQFGFLIHSSIYSLNEKSLT